MSSRFTIPGEPPRSATVNAPSRPRCAPVFGMTLALAFLNAIPWDPGAAAPAPDSDPAAQEAAQYDVEFSGPFSILDFIELGGRRP